MTRQERFKPAQGSRISKVSKYTRSVSEKNLSYIRVPKNTQKNPSFLAKRFSKTENIKEKLNTGKENFRKFGLK